MKILALGDPHGKIPKDIDKIVKKNKIEIIICVGDYGYTPDKPWLKESWKKGFKGSYVVKTYKEVVDKFCSYGLPVLTLRGNMLMTKTKPKADKILRRHKNLINKWTGKYKIGSQNFVFFDVLSEKSTMMNSDKKFSKKSLEKLSRREKKLNTLLSENPNSVLIAHNPPYGHVDKAYNGKHVGSKILFNAIKKHKPKLVLCGHIHEAKGRSKIGDIPVYNLGWHGDYVVFDIGERSAKLVESNFLK